MMQRYDYTNSITEETVKTYIKNLQVDAIQKLEKGDLASGIRNYNELLKVSKILSDIELEFKALRGIGDVSERSGNYQEALDRYSEAEIILARLKNTENYNPSLLITLLDKQGNCYEHLGRYHKAESLYKEALSRRNREKDIYKSHSYNNLGRLYLKWAKYDGDQLHDNKPEIETKTEAEAEAEKNHLEQAIENLKKAVNLRIKALDSKAQDELRKSKSHAAISLKLLGDCYFLKKEQNLASEKYASALQYLEDNEDAPLYKVALLQSMALLNTLLNNDNNKAIEAATIYYRYCSANEVELYNLPDEVLDSMWFNASMMANSNHYKESRQLYKVAVPYLRNGYYNYAIQRLEEALGALNRNEKLKESQYAAFLKATLAKAYYADSKYKEAIDSAQDALSIQKSLSDSVIIESEIKFYCLKIRVQSALLTNDIAKVREVVEPLDLLRESVSDFNNFKKRVIDLAVNSFGILGEDIMRTWNQIRQNMINSQLSDASLDESQEQSGNCYSERYYVESVLLNAMATSRTVQNGSIDISAAGLGAPLNKETWDGLTVEEKRRIKINPKVQNLDLLSLTGKTQLEIKELIQNNIQEATKYVFQEKSKLTDENGNLKIENVDGECIKRIIQTVALLTSDGIVKIPNKPSIEERHVGLLRNYNVNKFPYTAENRLKANFEAFCSELAQKLYTENPNYREIAAWVEYKINLTEHFYADGCGKVAAIISAFVCMLGKQPVPVFLDRADYFDKLNNSYAIPTIPLDIFMEHQGNGDEEKKDGVEVGKVSTLDKSQQNNWVEHYLSHFPLNNLHEQPAIYNAQDSQAQKDYYLQEARENLERISRLVGDSQLSTSAYKGKRNQIVKSYKSLSATVEADFQQVISKLYGSKGRKFNSSEDLESFIDQNIICPLLGNNLNMLDEEKKGIDSEEGKIFFRTENSNHLFYNFDNSNVKISYKNFIKELFAICNSVDSVTLGAFIHYNIAMTGQFFRDGNKRIALALETFFMMLKEHALPKFYDKKDWLIAAPIQLKLQENAIFQNKDTLLHDARFLRWLYKYNKLIDTNAKVLSDSGPTTGDENSVTSIPISPWLVVSDIKVGEQTIECSDNIIAGDSRFTEISKKIGLEQKDVVLFSPKRMLLHHIIVELVTNRAWKIDDENFATIATNLYNLCIGVVNDLNNDWVSGRLKAFRNIISSQISSSNLPMQSAISETILKCRSMLDEHYKKLQVRLRVNDELEFISKLAARELLQQELQHIISERTKGTIYEEINKNALPFYYGKARVVSVLAGGAASGKTSILKSHIVNQLDKQGALINACNINPDIFKPLLLDKGEGDYAARTHEESSYIKELIIKKIAHMLKEEGRAPSIILDVVNPKMKKFEQLLLDNPRINLYTVTCYVENTINVFGSIQRSYNRGKEEKSPDYGRYVPTRPLLIGHRSVSADFPSYLVDGQFEKIELYNTHIAKGQESPLIGSKNGTNSFYISDIASIVQFVKKDLINVYACEENRVYDKEVLDGSGLLKVGYIIQAINKYLEKNITLYLKSHASISIAHFYSQKLELLLSDMEESFAKLADNKGTEEIKNFCKEFIGELILNTLKSFSFQQNGLLAQGTQHVDVLMKSRYALVPVTLDLGIFDAEIEQKLSNSMRYRFLQILTSTCLREQQIEIDGIGLIVLTSNVVQRVCLEDANLFQNQDNVARYLPYLISEVRQSRLLKELSITEQDNYRPSLYRS